MSKVVHVFTLDLCPHRKIFWTSFGNILPHCKNESTWHWSILEIFGDVLWNMLQRFFFVPLSPLTPSLLIVHYSLFTTRCSPTSIAFWVTLNFEIPSLFYQLLRMGSRPNQKNVFKKIPKMTYFSTFIASQLNLNFDTKLIKQNISVVHSKMLGQYIINNTLFDRITTKRAFTKFANQRCVI